jgi:hypothetical protein
VNLCPVPAFAVPAAVALARARSPRFCCRRSPRCVGLPALSTYMPAIEQFGVYKLDINQGNYLRRTGRPAEAGQTRQQVRQILGTPLITSPFRRPLGLRLRISRSRARRSSIATSPSISSTTSSRVGRRRDAAVGRGLNRTAATRTLRPDPPPTTGLFLWFWDIFKQ